MGEPRPIITVQVKLRSVLGKFRPNPTDRAPFSVEITAGATVGDLIREQGIPERLAKLVVIDLARVDLDAELRDGVLVEVFPPIAGG